MSFPSLLYRSTLLVLAFFGPAALLGFALAGLPGAGVMIAGAGLFACIAVGRAERGIWRVYRVRTESPVTVQRTLDRVVSSLGGDSPRIFSFADPAPQALVARSPLSVGSILVSEGLLGALTEDELRELLRAGTLRLRARGIVLQSVCAWLAHGILELAPRSWVELLFGELRWHEELGAFSALRFITVFSFARFFVQLGRIPQDYAPHSLARLPKVSGEVANPGTCILHFADPWAHRSLFAL